MTTYVIYHSERALARTPCYSLGAGKLSENHFNSTFPLRLSFAKYKPLGERGVRRGGGNMASEQRALRNYLELGNLLRRATSFGGA